jgi:hypothetical protein
MLIVKIVWFYLSEFGFRVGIPMCHALEPLFAIGIHARAHTHIYIYTHTLRGCPCVATAYNNTHVNYPPKFF